MRRHPRRAQVDPSAPRAWATDDRTGFIGNHKDLQWQHDWRGNRIENLRILVFDPDKPQRQLGTIILPPDPPPIMNARPEQYFIEEEEFRFTSPVPADLQTQTGDLLLAQTGFSLQVNGGPLGDVQRAVPLGGQGVARVVSNSQGQPAVVIPPQS